MKFVLPNVEFIEQQPGIDGIYQAIANAARICYASERKDKIQELIDRLISSKHFRPLEFGTVYLTINVNEICKRTGKNIIEVNTTLTMLELQGLVKQVGANEFVKAV